MKEWVLVRVSQMMEIKDSEPCPYSSHSENSSRSATKCWKEGAMAKLAKVDFVLTLVRKDFQK